MAYSESKSKNGKETSTDRELLVQLDEWIRADIEHPTWVSWRENALKCFRYKENDQWTKEELKELATRGQPPTVNNQISVTINRLVGQFVKIKTRIGYRGRNQPQDQSVAEALTDTFLYIRQANALEFEEVEMADNGFTGGFGVLETYVEFDDIGQPEIKVRSEDPFSIFPDGWSRRYDWNEDATRISRAKWMDVKDAQARWPGKKNQIGELADGNVLGLLSDVIGFKNENYVDPKSHRVRPFEVWWKEKIKETICLFDDGSIVDKQAMTLKLSDGQSRPISKKELEELKKIRNYKEIDRLSHKMHCAVFISGVLLEHKEVDRKYFPFVPYFAYRKKSGEPYSLIFLAIPMQDAINKRESKALHLLNTNQAIMEENAVEDENELAIQKARPDGIIKLRVGQKEKFELHNNIELAATQFNMHNQGKIDFRHITGINPEALGEPSEVRSGVGIARKVAMTELVIAPLYDNVRRTRILLARNILELVQKYYTEEKLFYILDDLKKVKEVALNRRLPGGKIENDIKQGLYDVVAEDMPDITTLQQEQAQLLAQALPNILPFGPFWTKKLIQLSDIRNKEEYIKEIEAESGPPPLEPKINLTVQFDKLPPSERAFYYMKMGSPEMAQVVMQENMPPTQMLDAQADQAKAASDQQNVVLKAKTDAQKTMMDMAAKEMDLKAKGEMHRMNLEKGRMDMEAAKIKTALAITQAQMGKGNGSQGNQDRAR